MYARLLFKLSAFPFFARRPVHCLYPPRCPPSFSSSPSGCARQPIFPAKTTAVGARLPCSCPCPPSPSQFLLVDVLAAHKIHAVVARQLPNSLCPSNSSLPVNQQWIRKNAQYSDPSILLWPLFISPL
ncbi:Uncharacterized protein APZ42_025112 [Daphnia magna]|uniref:Uncharacterized protein n=1 Tax=Daphnia magna TaxID=35525 RepID=A0A164TGJ8_9CRUS|nr:Uncharacterized protein APZ42_025112 [Daphnia magna]